MSFLKTIGILKDDDDKKPLVDNSKKGSKTPSSTPTSSSSFTPPPTNFAQSAGVTIESSEFNDYLQKVFTERNFPGPDYYEFVEGLKKMQTMAIDEKTKFISLFAGLSAAGVTKEKLIETAGKYITIVVEQQEAFTAEVQNTLNTEVAGKEKSLQSFVDENLSIEQQMIALTEKKNKNTQEITRISQEVGEDRQTLALKQTSFDSAVKIFVNQINENVQKIQMYL
jgi:hypothetical protein